MSHTPPPPSPDNVANNTVDVFDSTGSHLLFSATGSSALTSAVNFANAQSGDIVSAGNGTYNGDLNVTAAMTIESANGADHVTTIGNGTNNQVNAAVHIESSNVTIGGDGHGLTIQANAAEAAAVYVDTSLAGSGHNIAIAGNVIEGNAATGGAILGGGGENGVTIAGNDFESGSVYINGKSNVDNASNHVNFIGNDIDKGAGGVVLDVSNSIVADNHFHGNDGVIVLQSPGDVAFHNNAEIQTINGGFTLHGNEILVTVDDGGASSNFPGEDKETDIVLNWHPDVGVNLADNWVGASGLTGTAAQDGSHEVQIDVSNGGEIDLFSHHVTVAQVEHDYGFA